MGKALRGEAVVNLPRGSKNAGHGRLRLARRVKSFQLVRRVLSVANGILTEEPIIYNNTSMVLFFTYPIKRFHAMIGLGTKRLHPGVVKAPGNREEIAGRIHVVPIEQ
jgi:hypothetical protein